MPVHDLKDAASILQVIFSLSWRLKTLHRKQHLQRPNASAAWHCSKRVGTKWRIPAQRRQVYGSAAASLLVTFFALTFTARR